MPQQRTCQPVGSKDAEPHSKQGEGVDEIHAEVEDALEQHHHKPELHDTGTRRDQKQSHPAGVALAAALLLFWLKSQHRLIRTDYKNGFHLLINHSGLHVQSQFTCDAHRHAQS